MKFRYSDQDYFNSQGQQEQTATIRRVHAMRKEYDFSKSVQNPYAKHFKRSHSQAVHLLPFTENYFARCGWSDRDQANIVAPIPCVRPHRLSARDRQTAVGSEHTAPSHFLHLSV